MVAMYSRCWGDIDPNVVAESVKGEFVFVDCVDEGGKNGPPEKVKCDPYPAAFSRFLRETVSKGGIELDTLYRLAAAVGTRGEMLVGMYCSQRSVDSLGRTRPFFQTR
jgi:hypothetical protein